MVLEQRMIRETEHGVGLTDMEHSEKVLLTTWENGLTKQETLLRRITVHNSMFALATTGRQLNRLKVC